MHGVVQGGGVHAEKCSAEEANDTGKELLQQAELSLVRWGCVTQMT